VQLATFYQKHKKVSAFLSTSAVRQTQSAISRIVLIILSQASIQLVCKSVTFESINPMYGNFRIV
jgi:hypothetical protein